MAVRQFLRVSLWVGIFALAGRMEAAAALRFDTAEIVLQSAVSYDGSQGTPNPFTDVQLTAQVTSPGGQTVTVDGFFDGDGAGGQSGNVFKVRVFADELGTWSWITQSNVASLNGKTGSFSVSGTLAGAFGKGPIVTDPLHTRYFKFKQGSPVYLPMRTASA